MNRTNLLLTLSSLTLLLVSGISPSLVVSATPSGSSASNWTGPMGDYPFNFDYSAQTQLSASNVGQIGLSWAFPIPAAPPTIKASGGLLSPQGDVVTPIIAGGVAYTITNFQLLIALDASNGKIVWTKDLSTLNAPNIAVGGIKGNITLPGHYHSLYYTSHIKSSTTPLIWVSCGTQCMEAFNANTGDLVASFDPGFGNPNPSYQHSLGNYGTNCLSNNPGAGFAHDWLVIDENSGTLVTGNGASEGTDSCRGMYVGFDITQTVVDNSAPKLLWRDFTIPPQDGSNPNWTISDIANMSHAWVYEPTNKTAIDLKAWATNNPASFHAFAYNDWLGPNGKQYAFNGTHSFAGSATGWGGAWALDPKTHTAYVATDQASPDANGTVRHGPDLWSDSVLSINTQTGNVNWAFQTTSHDLYDWDCSWGVILANATIAGQSQEVVIKGCKNGVFYEMNAQTGALIWAFTAPSIKASHYATQALWNDPANQTSMRVHDWPDYPSLQPYIQNPFAAGSIESNPAFDPTTNEAFVVTYNSPSSSCAGDVLPPQVKYPTSFSGPCHVKNTLKPPANAVNSTLWAIDAGTGKAVCSLNIADIGFRGGISVTNGMVVVPRSDGNIDFISESNCSKLNEIFIDGALVTNMAIGTDSKNNLRLIMPASGAVGSLALGFLGFPSQPGYLFALGLPASATQSVTTPSGTTQTVVNSSGIDTTTFYAVVAVAVIFILATGFLAARRGRKPAP
ncbi:MAG: PQQ-binding-like beta-propeller repeat protein [Thaumarchaeota archaeon]|nr:PQQ-binding-like beta-propeller repeat protein [Nitrososphaerota archaeon]